MSGHEERVTEEQLAKLRQGVIAGDLSIFTIAAHIDALKAERDAEIARWMRCEQNLVKQRQKTAAAVRRAEEAEAEVVNEHRYGEDNPDGCWVHPQGEDRKTIPGACPICLRVLGKGEG